MCVYIAPKLKNNKLKLNLTHDNNWKLHAYLNSWQGSLLKVSISLPTPPYTYDALPWPPAPIIIDFTHFTMWWLKWWGWWGWSMIYIYKGNSIFEFETETNVFIGLNLQKMKMEIKLLSKLWRGYLKEQKARIMTCFITKSTLWKNWIILIF